MGGGGGEDKEEEEGGGDGKSMVLPHEGRKVN
jgi:hypothetical protein